MWGGGEVWLMDMMSGLQNRGHSVSLLCRPGTELAENAILKGFDVHPMRIAGDFDPFVIRNARRLMAEKKIDVICTNMDKDLRFAGIAAKLAHVKGIVPSREIDYPLKNKISYRVAYNFLATRIIVNSEATRQTTLKNAPWLDPRRLRVIYKGIDISKYDTPSGNAGRRREFGIEDGAPIVTFVGQLDERKGIRYLLEAWGIVSRKFSSAKLLMAGAGPMKTQIEEFRRLRDLQSSIILAGFRKDVPDILLQSSMLVLPSLWEGFGYVLVEAMAAGLPVVATRTSSIPEIVVDKETGLLVSPGNYEELADSILHLLSHADDAKAMGKMGRKIAEEKFTINRMIDEFETVFREETNRL